MHETSLHIFRFFCIIVKTKYTQLINNLTTYSDRELLLLWQQGDDLAFEFLYKKYSVQFISIAVQKTNNREVSKELVQDIFITLFNNKTSVHKLSSFKAYFYVSLKNRILDHYRHSLIHKKYETYLVLNHDATYEIDFIETEELEKMLSDEISKLPPQCESVFRLKRERDLSNKEIAAELNISVKTVEQHMTKALKTLKIAFQIKDKTLFFLILLYLNKHNL